MGAPAPVAVSHLVVVGASGWIGRHVVAAAQDRGLRVSPVGRRRAAAAPTSWAPDDLPELLARPGTVLVHAAGATTGDASELRAANATLTANLADAALAAGIPLLAVGSAAEYGVPASCPVRETDPPLPVSDYGRSKLEATLALAARRRLGLVGTVARVFNVVGPQRPGSDPVQDFATEIRACPQPGGVVRAFDSSLVRDYASVAWVGERLVELAGHVGEEDVVNVCSGRGTSFRELILAMAKVRRLHVEIEDTRPGGVPCVVGDPSLLHLLVGVPPVEPLETLARLALGDGW